MSIEKISEKEEKSAKKIQILDELKKKDENSQDSRNLADLATDELKELNRELSNIPEELEDEIRKLRKAFDELLGHPINEKTDPSSPKFDPKVAMQPLVELLNALLSVLNPLLSVIGKIPILNELPKIFELATPKPDDPSVKSALDNLSAAASKEGEEIKKKMDKIWKNLQNKPEVPEDLTNELNKLKDNILALCRIFPLILVNLLFEMLDVVYSKLKIITKVIPLGNLFPLNLIGKAIEFVKVALMFTENAPSMIYSLLEGVLRAQMAKIAQLGIPKPPMKPDGTLDAPEYADIAAKSAEPDELPEQQKTEDEDIIQLFSDDPEENKKYLEEQKKENQIKV